MRVIVLRFIFINYLLMSLFTRLGFFFAGVGAVNFVAYKPLKVYLERSQGEIEKALEAAKHQ